ncbi:unnamed protein product [Victoria cruziana]
MQEPSSSVDSPFPLSRSPPTRFS